MRIAHRVWSGIAAVTFVVVAVVDINTMSNKPPESTSEASSYSVPAYGASGSAGYGSSGYGSSGYGSSGYGRSGSYGSGAPTNAPSTVAGETVTVTRVVDGDTFEVSGGRTVRVLGIDSCEANTTGGQQAKSAAQEQLTGGLNQPITLTTEPGVTTDPSGRDLRYVQLAGTDFGRFMVSYPHTGVYDGENDAAPSYVASLRSSEDGPRTCGGSTETTTRTPPPDDDDHVYVDPYDSGSSSSSDDSGSSSGGGGSNTGDSGHPCLPGERDGDNDGYCGET